MSDMVWSSPPVVLVLALACDAVLGDPRWLSARFSHPVALMGKLVSWVDRKFNRNDDSAARRKTNGIVAIVALVCGAALLGVLLERIFASFRGGWI